MDRWRWRGSEARVEPSAAPVDGADAEIEDHRDLDAIDALDIAGGDLRPLGTIDTMSR